MVSRDVALLATRMGAIVVVFTVCTFGFVGSPGVFGAMPDKRWHGDVGMYSAAFVDDSCLLSYRAGVSEWLTEACFITGLWSMFGLGGLNVKKDKEVGQWSRSRSIEAWSTTRRRARLGSRPRDCAEPAPCWTTPSGAMGI